MGSGDPLDYPELASIEGCLDALDLAGAQARLAELERSGQHERVLPYFVARLLFLRGKLDAEGVAARLREVVAQVGYFPRAAMLLHEAETGHLVRPSSVPPPSSLPSARGRPSSPPSGPPATASREEPARSRTEPSPDVTAPPADPRLKSDPPGADSYPPVGLAWQDPTATTEPDHRLAPTEPRSPLKRLEDVTRSRPPERRAVRSYTPVHGMSAISMDPQISTKALQSEELPDIPRGPRVPEFESNRRAPSYEPPGEPNGFNPLGHKSALPEGAGRYSKRPGMDPEVVESRGGRGRSPHAESASEGVFQQAPVAKGAARPGSHSSVPPTARATPRAAAAAASEGSRSAARQSPGAPKEPGRGVASALPPLFELAMMVDQGHFVRAIATINRAGAEVPVDYALLRARALAGAGYTDEAFEAVGRLTQTPLLDADIRAGAARLLVELGEPERGLSHAVQALRDDPEGRLSRLTYALAAVRCSRRRPDESLLVKAERALESFRGRSGPYAAIAVALEACVFAGLGEADRAVSVAERALGLDGRSVDAHAALVEAHALLGNTTEASAAWQRLSGLAPDEAHALSERFSDLELPPARPSARPGSFEPWDPAEAALVAGNRARAIELVETLAETSIKKMTKSASQSGLTAMAMVAATCLTEASVTRNLAPFDLSLWSIERVEAALDVVYGKQPRPRLRSDENALRLLIGSYLGEAIRLARGGQWEGDISELTKAKVIVGEQSWQPFQAVSARIHSGGRSRLVDGLRGALTHRGSAPWQSYIPNPVEVPCPWGSSTWPHTADIGRLGRSVMRSPIAVLAELTGHGVLDLSLPSLGGIDAYLESLAPVGAPIHSEANWMRRTAVFVGGYVGEVLREMIGGQWEADGQASSASDFVLVVRDRIEARPVDRVLQRLSGGHHEPTSDYVSAIARRIARSFSPR